MAAQAVAAPQHAKKPINTRVITQLLFGLIFLLALLRCLFTLDPDFGWHVASGQYILTHWLPQTDIYTYTATDFPWIHHEWLADVINAVIFKIGNLPLLALFFATLWTFAVRLMVGRKQNWKSCAATLIVMIVMAQFIAIRDTVWTVLLLAVTHRIFNRYRAYLPLLFIIWANLHGGFMIGLAYVAWRIMYERRWRDAWILPAAIIGTFINPYGVTLYREIFATLFDTTLHAKINEWRQWAIDASMILLPIAWFVPIISDLRNKRWRGIVRFDTLLLVASMLSIRHFVLFALLSLPRITTFYSHVTLPKISAPKNVFSPKRIIYIFSIQAACLIVLVLFIAACIVALQEPLRFQPQKDNPVAAVKSLQAKACNGNIFNDYDIGGYLIWKYPRQKVYIDGRMPSWQFNGVNYMDDYLKVTKNDAFQKEQFTKYHIACAIVPNGSKLAESLQKQGWGSEVDNDSGWTLLRK